MSGGYFYEGSDFYLNALVSMVRVFHVHAKKV